MAKRVFSAGFVWSVIEKKWPGFEAAFLSFEPPRLLLQPDEFWEDLTGDKRIVRNPQKIMAVRGNARFVADIAREHGSFGKFLAQWPAGDQVGLLELLGKRGAASARARGSTSCASSARTASSRRATSSPACATPASTSPRIPPRSGTWGRSRPSSMPGPQETGLPLTHLSRICAMSIGENYDPETLRGRAAMDE